MATQQAEAAERKAALDHASKELKQCVTTRSKKAGTWLVVVRDESGGTPTLGSSPGLIRAVHLTSPPFTQQDR